MSRECPLSVKMVSRTLGTPFGHSRARGPEGPRHTPPDTPSDTPIFGDTLSDTPRDTSGPKGPKPAVGGRACLNCCYELGLEDEGSPSLFKTLRPRGVSLYVRCMHRVVLMLRCRAHLRARRNSLLCPAQVGEIAMHHMTYEFEAYKIPFGACSEEKLHSSRTMQKFKNLRNFKNIRHFLKM